MNKRIQELAEQATTYIDPIANDGVCWDFDREKFAQLIVRECGEWVNDNLGLLDEEARADLFKHFGIEE